MSKTETRAFKMHPKLLFDVIQRQAGTIGKAALEGVMNAIDAGATQIDIDILPDKLAISDNGGGFKDRYEIEHFFEVFGQPHDPDEKKVFGTFRMGRGQLFAFGKNFWETNRFAMEVDIQGKGLDYTLTEHPSPHNDGCRVVVELYKTLASYDIRNFEDEMKAAVKWVAVPVKLNGVVISRDPQKEKWDLVIDEALVRFRESGDMRVYNLGVMVRAYGSYNFGCGGEVVSVKSMKLNFARNDVMSDCPVWQVIKKVINQNADKQVRKKKSLTEAQRGRLAKQFRDKELEEEDARRLAIFTDVAGKHWSIDKLCGRANDYRKICTSAPKDDDKGDKLMQTRLAFVFAEECLERFGVEDLKSLVAGIKHYCSWFPFKEESYRRLTKDLDDVYQFLPDSEWTALERAVIRTIDIAQYPTIKELSDERTIREIRLGRASTADAWTDGVTYIAFNRDFLARVGTMLPGWVRIGQTLIHELVHDEPTSDTHSHSPDFYEMYHNSRNALPKFVDYAISRFGYYLEGQKKRLSKAHLKERDRLAAQDGKVAALHE